MTPIKADLLPVIFKIISDAEVQLMQITGCKIDLNMSVHSREMLTPDDALKMTLQKVVCNEFSVSWSQIAGPRGNTNVSNARRVYMLLAKELLMNRCTQLGRELNRNHATVLTGQKKIKDWIKVNDGIVDKINNIKKQLYAHNA